MNELLKKFCWDSKQQALPLELFRKLRNTIDKQVNVTQLGRFLNLNHALNPLVTKHISFVSRT